MERLSGVRTLVSQLYESLNVEEHQLKKERELLAKIEELKHKLEPLEEVRRDIVPGGRCRGAATAKSYNRPMTIRALKIVDGN